MKSIQITPDITLVSTIEDMEQLRDSLSKWLEKPSRPQNPIYQELQDNFRAADELIHKAIKGECCPDALSFSNLLREWVGVNGSFLSEKQSALMAKKVELLQVYGKRGMRKVEPIVAKQTGLDELPY